MCKDDENCGNCKYWTQEFLDVDPSDCEVGECIRFPPTTQSSGSFIDPYQRAKETKFPVISYVCVCGEFVERSRKEAKK